MAKRRAESHYDQNLKRILGVFETDYSVKLRATGNGKRGPADQLRELIGDDLIQWDKERFLFLMRKAGFFRFAGSSGDPFLEWNWPEEISYDVETGNGRDIDEDKGEDNGGNKAKAADVNEKVVVFLFKYL
jgi:hypothetical protein